MPLSSQASGSGPAPPAELAALLAASTDEDREEAWAAFVRAYTPTILRVARSLGGDADAVMDRYAFALDRLRIDECRRLHAWNRPGAGEFGLWLVVVVRRLCLDHYRERYGRAGRSADVGERECGADRSGRRRLVDLVADRTDPALLAAPSTGAPDEVLARAERLRGLSQALDRLAPRDRLLLRLRFSADLPAREIARLMHFPTLFHVYRRLDRVMRELRSDLARLGVEPEP